MSREIYTYTDLTKLNESKLFEEIKRYPQIAVASDLRKGLKGTMEVDRVEGLFSRDPSMKVTEFQTVAKLINENWNTDVCKFNETIILAEYIRNKMEEAGEDKRMQNWLTGCMRNLSSMLSAIILLEQADVRPEQLKFSKDRNVRLFVEAWNYLSERDEEVLSYRKRLASLNTRQAWEPILDALFPGEKNIDTIVLHGFYYITPFQQRVMNLLEEAGYRLIFLFPYDERYPFVYEIWTNTYSVERGFPPKSQWHMEREITEDPYGDIFEGKEKVSITNNLNIREYGTVMEFVNDIRKIRKEGYAVYSPDFKTGNKLLKEYYPEEYGERKILSYPIGQFISTLNQMWDDEHQTITLDEDRLIECFSSGWLSVCGISGRQYLQDLVYILPFFYGCHTIEEWEDRIDKLKDIEENVMKTFLKDQDAEEAVARWQEAIGNPLANFSMFAVDTEKLDIILVLIKQLLNMARELFGTNQVIRVTDHVSKLRNILKKHEISDEIYPEEKELIGCIFDTLSQPSDFDNECVPSDIAKALNLFICGKFEEGEIQSNKTGLIYPLYFIDAACIKNKGKVHICMCDASAMPGGNKDYIWPLSSGLVRSCYQNTQNSLILNIMQIMESNALCNRYFMYCALKNREVTISWIGSMNEKLLAPSPYIKLVCDATGKKAIPAKRYAVTFERVADSFYGSGRIEEYDNEKTPAGMVKEARMAYALCPMKYTLGYVLEKFPTFQSDFQQNYALNAFISAIAGLMKEKGMSVDQIYKNAMSLFPGLRKVEKRQVYDYIRYDRREDDMDYGNRTQCGSGYYTDERLKLHYPNPQIREAVIGRFGKLATPDGRKGMNLYEVMEAVSAEEMMGKKDMIKAACTFCPHIHYCRNAVFAADQENYYD